MARKDDLIETAKGLGIELDSNETIADLEAKIAEQEAAASLEPVEGGGEPGNVGEIKRAKVNRGSRRRIERAISKLNSEIDAAIKEFDMQAFVADDDGNRVDEWDAVKALRTARAVVNEQVNQLLAG